MTTTRLENLKTTLVAVLSEGGWERIKSDHKRVGLAWHPELEPGWGKNRYVEAVLGQLAEDAVMALARRCIAMFPDRCAIGVQDALWWAESGGESAISEVTRLTIADALDGRRMHPQQDPVSFVRTFAHYVGSDFGPSSVGYTQDGRLFTERPTRQDFLSAFGQVGASETQRLQYSHRQLLEEFGFRQWHDRRVYQFLETMVHPALRRGDEQAAWAGFINELLAADRHSLVESERLSGHPVFKIQRIDRGVSGRAKNLIFASTGPKPVLGFRDAINNDVLVLENAEHCLFYEDPIGDDGLLWDELVAWWTKLQDGKVNDAHARKALGKRLLAAVGSPPEKLLFTAYFQRWAPILRARLPALLPQVYLHYDPATVKQLHARGEEKRFLLQRMDFLMLLPHRVRVVIEIDGQQHYSKEERGQLHPSPAIYAQTVRGDRDLRLAGYEVYRFSGHELHTEERAAAVAGEFFSRLFQRHGVTT